LIKGEEIITKEQGMMEGKIKAGKERWRIIGLYISEELRRF